MKRILLVAAALLPFAAQARELSAGTVEVSGSTSLGFVTSNFDVEGGGEVETKSWDLGGGAAYYFVPNVAVGVAFQLESIEMDFDGASTDTTTASLGPQLMFNLSLSEQASLKAGGGLLYLNTEVEGVELDGLGWNVGAGVSFFLHRRISLDATLAYQNASLEEDDFDTDVDLTGFGVGVGLSFYFGGR